uniref:Tyrosine-protein phosphatase domain-containing protein n=1 Tax=Timema monikensis TaxID=170555 RepID=A0A7R9E4C5_9NEOP|nr:unnamed protein product [Timema monikensis]
MPQLCACFRRPTLVGTHVWATEVVLPGLYVGNYRDSKDSLQLERFEITHIVAIHDTPRKLHLDKHYLCIMASDTPDQNLTQYFPLCNDFIHAARLRGGHVLIHWNFAVPPKKHYVSGDQMRTLRQVSVRGATCHEQNNYKKGSVGRGSMAGLSSKKCLRARHQKTCGKRRKYHLVWLAGEGELGAQIPDRCIEMIPSPIDPPKSQSVKISGRWLTFGWVIFTETSSIRILAGMSRSVTVAVAYIMSVTTLNWKEALKVVRVGRSVANPNFGFQKQLQEFEAFKLLEERRRMKERFPSLLLVNQDEEQCRLMLHSYQSLILSRDLCEGDCSLGQTCPTGLCRSPSKRLLRRKSSSARNTPPQSPRILPATPEPSATGLPRSSSTLSRRPRSGPAGLHYYTASAPPSRSGSRLDVSDLSGFEWTRGGSAPVSPQSSPPVSPQHFLRRRASVVANKRGT